ncbi:hypothetical protein SOVF_105120 [Spinacia oleracea]|nr:hypothetical protein SOVF_105120 [Spinacia oleracea]
MVWGGGGSCYASVSVAQAAVAGLLFASLILWQLPVTSCSHCTVAPPRATATTTTIDAMPYWLSICKYTDKCLLLIKNRRN